MHGNEFQLKASLTAAVVMVILLVMSVAASCLLPVSFGWHLLAVVLLLFYGLCLLRQYALLTSHQAIQQIQFIRDDIWRIKTRHHTGEARLDGNSTVTTLVSVLCFQWTHSTAIPALQVAVGDSKGGDRGSPPFGASKSLAFAQHRNKEAFPRFLAGMAAHSRSSCSCVIFKDSLPRSVYRRLIVTIKS